MAHMSCAQPCVARRRWLERGRCTGYREVCGAALGGDGSGVVWVRVYMQTATSESARTRVRQPGIGITGGAAALQVRVPNSAPASAWHGETPLKLCMRMQDAGVLGRAVRSQEGG